MIALMARMCVLSRERMEKDMYRAIMVDVMTDLCKITAGGADKYKRKGWQEVVKELRKPGGKKKQAQKAQTAEEIIQDIYKRL